MQHQRAMYVLQVPMLELIQRGAQVTSTPHWRQAQGEEEEEEEEARLRQWGWPKGS
jgi:hypothetical protein